MSRRSRAWLIVLTGLLVAFALLGWVVEAWTEWLWFSEVGATNVWSGQLWTRLALFVVALIVVGAFIFGNLYPGLPAQTLPPADRGTAGGAGTLSLPARAPG